jgi:hypothetical protein
MQLVAKSWCVHLTKISCFIFIQMVKRLLFKKMGYQEENYNFWDFSTTIFDIKCPLWMKLAPALVPLEAWFWYMLFLDLLSAKLFLRFLIEYQNSITSKTVSQIFPVMLQSLLKSHYVYTAWLHKISPTLIVRRVCVKKFYLSGQIIVDLWFKVNPEVFPWHICDFYSRKWGTKRKITTFGIFPLQFLT